MRISFQSEIQITLEYTKFGLKKLSPQTEGEVDQNLLYHNPLSALFRSETKIFVYLK